MNDDLDPFAREVLEFWFGPDATSESVSEEKGDMWFANGSNFDDISPDNLKDYETNVTFAVAHRDIISRFGYFPYRNAILGRPLSDEERSFLQEPNSAF